MSSAPAAPLSAAEYLKIERAAERKSEFINGRMYMMSGVSREHATIVMNLSRELSTQLRRRHCDTYASDMRVKIDSTGAYVYPDLVVVCGEARFEDAHVDTLLNPTVIVEVLSQSTEAYDRGAKFAHYRRVESLREYLLVSQTEARVEKFSRIGDEWVLQEWVGLEAAVLLNSTDATIPMAEVYDRVAFEAQEPEKSPPAPSP
jgi:Uma2 family endonuclease